MWSHRLFDFFGTLCLLGGLLWVFAGGVNLIYKAIVGKG